MTFIISIIDRVSVVTQTIHKSQKIIDEDNETITFSLKVHPTVEFIQLVLGWGSEVKLIEPNSFQNTIKESLLKNLDQY